MHRVLSLETSRCSTSTSSEFVSKRFCCSLSLAISFLALIAGFFLGKNAAERSHHHQISNKKCIISITPQNTIINNITNTLKSTEELLNMLKKPQQQEQQETEIVHNLQTKQNCKQEELQQACTLNKQEEVEEENCTQLIENKALPKIQQCLTNINRLLFEKQQQTRTRKKEEEETTTQQTT